MSEPVWDFRTTPPEDIAVLVALVNAVRPKRILEFGAGRSTIAFGYAARDIGSEVVSREDDPSWARQIAECCVGLPVLVTNDPRDADVRPGREWDFVFVDSAPLETRLQHIRDVLHELPTALVAVHDYTYHPEIAALLYDAESGFVVRSERGLWLRGPRA